MCIATFASQTQLPEHVLLLHSSHQDMGQGQQGSRVPLLNISASGLQGSIARVHLSMRQPLCK
jgi:hypothetical protein